MAVNIEEKKENFINFAFIFYFLLACVSLGVPYLFGKGEEIIILFKGKKPVVIQFVVGFLIGFGLVLISRIATKIFPVAKELELKLAVMLGPLNIWEAGTLALLSGFSEELFFRITLYFFLGPVLSTIIFGLCHIGPGKAFRFWTISALFAGSLFALLVWLGYGFISVFIAHAVTNMFNLYKLGKIAKTDNN